MEYHSPSMLLLIFINVFIHKRVKIEGDRNFGPIHEVIEYHEMVGAQPIKYGVQGDVFDDSP